MAMVKQENSDIHECREIYTKLKKLHEIAKTNKKAEGEDNNGDDDKLASKRKTDLNLDGLSDESTLNSTEQNRTKRRRLSYSPSNFSLDDYQNSDKFIGKYALTLSNLPDQWTYDQIKQYVVDECGVNVLSVIDSRCQKSEYQLRLKFINRNQYDSVLSKLKSKESEGKLNVSVEGESDAESEDSDATVLIGKSEVKSEPPSCKSKLSEDDQENNLYGLNPKFLKSLNISPPLVKWINVSNFRCDKSELRDLFEMAGRVVICFMTNSVGKNAKIMYSHPLEAVQAISLLNGQIFYGRSLNVSLDHTVDNALPLPKGLQNFGLGLGEMGKPLCDVAAEYERFINGVPSSVNSSLFGKEEITDSERYSPSKPSSSGQFGAIGQMLPVQRPNSNSPPVSPKPTSQEPPSSMVQNPLANMSLGGQKYNPLTIQNSTPHIGPLTERPRCFNTNMQNVHRPNFRPVTPNTGLYPSGPNRPGFNFQRQPGFQVSPNRGQFGQDYCLNSLNPPNPNMRPQGPFMQSGQMSMPRNALPRMGAPNPLPVPPPNMHMPAPGPSGPRLPIDHSLPPVMVLKGKDPVTLQITNLPAQVTFASLCSKLSKVGQVVSLEFTMPGSAMVKFSNPYQAQMCFQYFSPSRFGHKLGIV